MRVLRGVFSLVALLAFAVAPCAQASATDYTTFHYDNARDGWNSSETTLTPANVAGGGFHRINAVTLDGYNADAQPLYLSSEYIPAVGYSLPVVYVATDGNTIMAFDARNGNFLWSQNYGLPVSHDAVGGTPPGGCGTTNYFGIQGTPVIDRTTDTMYFDAFTYVNGVGPQHIIHAISPQNGADKQMPIQVTGNGNTPPQLGWVPTNQRQRPALTLANGLVYVAFGSFCDKGQDSSFGQVFGYPANNIAAGYGPYRWIATNLPHANCVVSGKQQYMGTIWGSGYGPAADASGNIYVATSNGCINFNANNTNTSMGAFSQSVVRLTPGLQGTTVNSGLFSPCNDLNESTWDLDISSGGVVLLPDQGGAHNHVLIAGGKTGISYVVDRDNMSGHACPDGNVSQYRTSAYNSAQPMNGIFGGPAVWQQSDGRTYVAVAGGGSNGLNSYVVNAGVLSPVGSDYNTGDYPLHGEGGTMPVVSSNGTQPGTMVLWYVLRPGNPGQPLAGRVDLVAYNAESITGPNGPTKHGWIFHSLDQGNLQAGTWDTPNGSPFLSPTVADGRVYVASFNQLTIWGLN